MAEPMDNNPHRTRAQQLDDGLAIQEALVKVLADYVIHGIETKHTGVSTVRIDPDLDDISPIMDVCE